MTTVLKRLIPLWLILGTVLIAALVTFGLSRLSAGEGHNIFNEIYTQTDRTYLGNNIFNESKNVTTRNQVVFNKEMNETGKYNPEISYKAEAIPETYSEIEIDFNIHKGIKGFIILFKKQLEENTDIWYIIHYNAETFTLEKEVEILVGEKTIENEEEIRTVLKQNHVTANDLDTYYNAIVNNLVLKDWTSIYDSQYSPDDYGNVKVKTQWENW